MAEGVLDPAQRLEMVMVSRHRWRGRERHGWRRRAEEDRAVVDRARRWSSAVERDDRHGSGEQQSGGELGEEDDRWLKFLHEQRRLTAVGSWIRWCSGHGRRKKDGTGSRRWGRDPAMVGDSGTGRRRRLGSGTLGWVAELLDPVGLACRRRGDGSGREPVGRMKKWEGGHGLKRDRVGMGSGQQREGGREPASGEEWYGRHGSGEQQSGGELEDGTGAGGRRKVTGAFSGCGEV